MSNAVSAAELAVGNLRCEGVANPSQVDTVAPRFSWTLDSNARAIEQTAWQMRIIEVDGSDRAMAAGFETPRVAVGCRA